MITAFATWLLMAPPATPPTPPPPPAAVAPIPAPARPRPATPPPVAPPPAAKTAPRPAGQGAPADAEVPAQCKAVVDQTAELFDAVVKPLIDEAQKREDANAERGQEAFEAALALRQAEVRGLREAARAAEQALDDQGKKRCEDYAFRRFSRSFARLGPAAAFYTARASIFRTLGQTFLR